MEHMPWVEKYRPKHFEDIVLEDTNKKILNNVIKTGYFPNLLFMAHLEQEKPQQL